MIFPMGVLEYAIQPQFSDVSIQCRRAQGSTAAVLGEQPSAKGLRLPGLKEHHIRTLQGSSVIS